MEKILNFKNNECTFTVSSDFNVHLERDFNGNIVVYQKTCGTKFAPVKQFPQEDKNFDYDFNAAIYPKEIKIVSSSNVNKGILTTNE